MGSMKDKVNGKLKEIEGRLTGDKVRTAQGKVENKKGDIKAAGERAASRVRAGVSRAKRKVRSARAKANARARARGM